MSHFIKTRLQTWLAAHPRASQWLWFVGLWFMGLFGMALIAYPFRLLLHFV